MDANEQEFLEEQDSWTNNETDDADAVADDEVGGQVADEVANDVVVDDAVADDVVADDAVADDAVADGAVADDAVADTEAVRSDAELAAEAAASGAEWFVVHSYSGYENKVKKNLEQRIETMGMQNKIFRVVVPTEEEVEIRDGQRRTSRRRVFPGYILVQMVMDDESWYVVRNTPGVTGFVGSGTRPTPLSEEEVDKILRRMETEQPRIKVSFRVGETVRITEGPFADFMAVVDELYPDRGKVRVLVSFFGRETPVEMDFLQVERI